MAKDIETGFYGDQANTAEPEHARLKRFYTPQPVDVTKSDYDDWAGDYDKNTVTDSGYCAHEVLADVVARLVTNRSQKIIELGCGTGLLGTSLKERGFTNIEGWDLSPGMLSKAEETKAYTGLFEIDVTKALPFNAASCEVMVSVGVYGPGIVGPEHVELLVPPLAKDGLSIHSFNGLSWRKRPFEQSLNQLIDAGKISVVEQTWAPYIAGENIDGVYLAFTRS